MPVIANARQQRQLDRAVIEIVNANGVLDRAVGRTGAPLPPEPQPRRVREIDEVDTMGPDAARGSIQVPMQCAFDMIEADLSRQRFDGLIQPGACPAQRESGHSRRLGAGFECDRSFRGADLGARDRGLGALPDRWRGHSADRDVEADARGRHDSPAVIAEHRLQVSCDPGLPIRRSEAHDLTLPGRSANPTSIDGSMNRCSRERVNRRTAGALLIALCGLGSPCTARSAIQTGEAAQTIDLQDTRRIAFNVGWRFLRGEAEGAQQADFDDSHWSRVRLPHDWAIDGPFDAALNPHTGALPISGVGWYRNSFRIARHESNRNYTIEFDGAMSNSRVWINGHELGGRPYGYIGFAFDLTPYLMPSPQHNVLAVRLAPQANSSRWYPGAGIYRNVWITQQGPIGIARWGTTITTPRVSADASAVTVQTVVFDRQGTAAPVLVRSTIFDAIGRRVARADRAVVLDAGVGGRITTTLELAHPQRWDIERPYLYRLVTELLQNGRILDRDVSDFGIRTVAFERDRGLILNERHLKFHGVCLHHDLGALGAAVNRRAIERQLQILKAAGVNAIRTSHNPPAPELLEYADRMGFLVIDEAFDMWHTPKVPNGYSRYFDEWSERDLRDMIRRDRNHPSVVLWSIGNEVPEQGEPDGWAVARRLAGIVRDEDPTRPTTAAFNDLEGAIGNGLAAEVDIPGFNYTPTRYAAIRQSHPDWIIYGSETASCVSSRGTYHLPLESYAKHPSLQLSSYDIIAPPWAYCPDVEFAAQDADQSLLGEFVWTGFDYLGEPTPYFAERSDNRGDWPSRSSYFGMVDLAGFPKDRYYLYQSVWTDQPMVHLLPHWNWEGHEGQSIPVMVYSNAEEVELSLNGLSLGRKRVRSEPVELPVGPNVSTTLKFESRYRLLWRVPYQAGLLQAVAFRGGLEVARDAVATAGAPARIRLLADRHTIAADGDDLAFITVRIEDREAHLCPNADDRVHFVITGAGHLAEVDNGNPATVESFHAHFRKAFHGLALLIVRSSAGKAGTIRIAASADGLAGDHLQLRSRPLKRAAHGPS